MTQAQIATITAAVIAALNASKPSKKASRPVKAASTKPSKADFETALIAAAVKLGYSNPEPRFNLLTYDRWLEKGLRVRKGEKSIRVLGRKSGLFHESQCSPETKTAPNGAAVIA